MRFFRSGRQNMVAYQRGAVGQRKTRWRTRRYFRLKRKIRKG